MSVFRIERNKNYTVMSNYHLRDTTISLKSKGLLSMMLSLPDERNYTTRGLAKICKEGVDAIGGALRELEKAGYIVRRVVRNERGRICDMEYTIYEQPHPRQPDPPRPDTNALDTENSDMVTRGPETTVQINKDRTRKDPSNTDSIPFRAAEPPEPKRTETSLAERMEEYRALIRDNIQYPLLVAQNPDDADLIDEIVELMTETVCARRKTTRVCGSDFPAEVVKSRMLKLDAEHKTELEEIHILSPSGKATWSKATIQNILRNEKYAGNVLLQKTFTADFLTKKVKKNRGEVTQYYVTDNHPAIIPREIFQQVQLELARRSSRPKVSQRKTKTERGKYTSKFALSERLVCGECGCMYRRTQWVKRDGTKEYVWRCINRLENGKKYCKNSLTLKEPQLHEAIMAAIREQFTDRDKVKESLKAVEEKIILHSDDKQNAAPLLTRIQEIDQAMSNLLLLVSHSADSSIYDAKFKELTREKADLQKQVDAVEQAVRQDQDRKRKLQAVLEAIERQPVDLERYDDDLVRRIIEQIEVRPDGKRIIRFIKRLQN